MNHGKATRPPSQTPCKGVTLVFPEEARQDLDLGQRSDAHIHMAKYQQSYSWRVLLGFGDGRDSISQLLSWSQGNDRL